MMTIGSVAGANNYRQAGGVGGGMQMDSVSRSIQKQIENAQKQLQELSSNQDMPLEEKMKKRQEIQQEITSLNQQLRQHQIEMRKEQQAERASAEDMAGNSKKADVAKAGAKGNGMSQASMQAMISADTSMKQAQVQGSVATQMEGKAHILESEIKMDKARGANVEKKEEELAKIQKNAQEALSGQMSTLAEANKTLQDSKETEADSEANETEIEGKVSAAADSKANKAEEKSLNGQEVSKNSDDSVNTDSSMTAAEAETSQPIERISVDIRL